MNERLPSSSSGESHEPTLSLTPNPQSPPTIGEGDPTLPPSQGEQPIDPRAPAGYVIERELGRGGMGVVYLARSLKLQRPCALKMILSGVHADDHEVNRFCDEAQAAARLQHPGIVQIFEIGEHESKPFMALEYCAGGSLDSVLAKNPLPAREAASLVQSLAEAVQAAHEAKVIHRDLKPANVLLNDKREPKITDFGLAKKLDEPGLTATGAIMGTPSYIPPEQASASREIGPPADIYALGAILYECLTGRPPFKAATKMETLMQVLTDEPVPVRALNASMPTDLETIALKCLQKDLGRRYGSAQALADDLGRFLNGEPIQARPVGPLERAVKWVRRNPIVSALAATVFLVLTTGLTVSWVLTGWAYQEAETARQARIEEAKQTGIAKQEAATARAAEKEAEKQTGIARENEKAAKWNERLAKDSAHAIKIDLAVRAREQSDWEWMRQILEETHADYGQTVENRFVRALWVKHAFALKNLIGHTGEVSSVSWSPDGKRILTGSLDQTARVWDAETGTEKLALKGHTGSVYSVAWSPDGKRILTGSGGYDSQVEPSRGEAKLWDAVKGTEVFTLRGHTDSVNSVAYSPDGKRILTGSWDNTAKLWDAEKGNEALTLMGHKDRVCSVSFSPDGKRILTGSGNLLNHRKSGEAKLWDAEKGTQLLALKGHTYTVTSVCFSPDGKRILTGSGQRRDPFKPGEAKLWDAEKGTELLTLVGHTGPVTSVCFSPDGKRILTGSMDRTAKLWDAEKGTELLTLGWHRGWVASVDFSTDGTKACAWDDTGKVLAWSVVDGMPIPAGNPALPSASGSAISPGGRLSAKPAGTTVTLIDLLNPPPAGDLWPLPDAAERKAYHTAQADAAEKAGQWFAVAFHVGRLLLDDPDNADLKKRRDEALQKHAGK